MKQWCIVVSDKNFCFFEEFVKALEDTLYRFSFKVQIRHQIPSDGEFTYVFVIGIHEFPAVSFSGKTKYIGLQTEQLPQIGSPIGGIQANNFKHLQNILISYNHIFDVYEGNVNFLRSNEINALPFQVGYHSSFDFYKDNQTDFNKIYDIVFFGLMTPRRQKLIDQLSKKWSICSVTQAFGKPRNDLLLLSKICLNLHVEDSDFFEKFRVELLYLSNKCFVISEESLYHTPLVRNKHFVMRPYHLIESAIEYYLRNPFQCEKIADAGYNFMKSSHLFENNLRLSLKQIGI